MPHSVVIGTFGSPREAEEAADELREADVSVELADSAGDVVGGVELRVQKGDADRARDILDVPSSGGTGEEPEEDPFDEIDPSEEAEWDEMKKGLHCPNCGSTRVSVGSAQLYGYLAATFVTFAAIFALPNLAGVAGVLFVVLVVVGIWAGAKRRFPLTCSECDHRGPWAEFDPTRALDEPDD